MSMLKAGRKSQPSVSLTRSIRFSDKIVDLNTNKSRVQYLPDPGYLSSGGEKSNCDVTSMTKRRSFHTSDHHIKGPRKSKIDSSKV
mmetsp:Transcript_34458/g.52734  ORF Transcript_34458/g.52734 Transcript_34458/m.52734 type:complete len:86 (+) Transcript_34458:1868-2125(+)